MAGSSSNPASCVNGLIGITTPFVVTGTVTANIMAAPHAVITISPLITTVSLVVVAANAARVGLILYNNSANSVYLKFASVCTSSTCTLILATFAQYVMLGPVVYTGVISGIRNAGTGSLVVTELTL